MFSKAMFSGGLHSSCFSVGFMKTARIPTWKSCLPYASPFSPLRLPYLIFFVYKQVQIYFVADQPSDNPIFYFSGSLVLKGFSLSIDIGPFSPIGFDSEGPCSFLFPRVPGLIPMSHGLNFLTFVANAKFDTWYAFRLAFLRTFQIDEDGPFLIDKIETLPDWYFRDPSWLTNFGLFWIDTIGTLLVGVSKTLRD